MSGLLWRADVHYADARAASGAAGGAGGDETTSTLDTTGRPAAMRSPLPSPSLRKARSAFYLSPRMGSTDDGFFSWKRWYGAPSAAREPVPPLPPADEVSRLVREALRRRREADDNTSLASSSASSQASEPWADSPASSDGTWDTSASESSKPGALRTSGYEQEDLDALPTLSYALGGALPSPRLRGAESAATLKAPRMIRRVSSSASISPVPVELPPHSPYTATSPTLTSSMYNDDPFAALPPQPAFASPALDPAPSTFRTRLASSLRKSASSITLRNPLGLSLLASSPTARVPAPSTAATILRDLLLKHDAAVDPSTEPLSPLFDPTLAPFAADAADEADDVFEFDARHYASSSSEDEHDALYSSSDGDFEDDPFRVTAAPADIAWMAPSLALSTSSLAYETVNDDAALDSPSSAFPPFDPFALPPLGPPPPIPSAGTGASRPPRAKVITRQRSFVDPRTRQLRTAPSVCVTPSTPEKKRFGAGA